MRDRASRKPANVQAAKRNSSSRNASGPDVAELSTLQRAADEDKDVLELKAMQKAADPQPKKEAKSEVGIGLPQQLKAGIEKLSGLSMDHVKVHRNSSKPAKVGAHAYAQGSDIHLASGQERHLPHEAWHVVQQAQGRVKPTIQKEGVAINDDASLESEADIMGARALNISIPHGRENVELKTPDIVAADIPAIQRFSFSRAFNDHTEWTADELCKSAEFKALTNVKKFIKKRGEAALEALLASWEDRSYHNVNALAADLNRHLKSDKEPAKRERAELAQAKLLSDLRDLRKRAKLDLQGVSWESLTSGFAGQRKALVALLENDKAAENVCRNLALVTVFDETTVDHFSRRVFTLATLKERRAPIDWPGVVKTFDMVSKHVAGSPGDYSCFGEPYGERFTNFYGLLKSGGMPLSFKGISSELDAILNVDFDELAEHEHTFSGSTYTDPDNEAMNKNVDVSYIDKSGTLHLIENGKDMHTLSNKAVGSHDQKAIYRHLTFNTRRLRHQPVSPLTRGQMQRTQITNVLWWYAIPPEAVELRETISEKDQKTLRSIAAAGAGLRIGPRRYTSAQLLEIAERRAW